MGIDNRMTERELDAVFGFKGSGISVFADCYDDDLEADAERMRLRDLERDDD